MQGHLKAIAFDARPANPSSTKHGPLLADTTLLFPLRKSYYEDMQIPLLFKGFEAAIPRFGWIPLGLSKNLLQMLSGT